MARKARKAAKPKVKKDKKLYVIRGGKDGYGADVVEGLPAAKAEGMQRLAHAMQYGRDSGDITIGKVVPILKTSTKLIEKKALWTEIGGAK